MHVEVNGKWCLQCCKSADHKGRAVSSPAGQLCALGRWWSTETPTVLGMIRELTQCLSLLGCSTPCASHAPLSSALCPIVAAASLRKMSQVADERANFQRTPLGYHCPPDRRMSQRHLEMSCFKQAPSRVRVHAPKLFFLPRGSQSGAPPPTRRPRLDT